MDIFFRSSQSNKTKQNKKHIFHLLTIFLPFHLIFINYNIAYPIPIRSCRAVLTLPKGKAALSKNMLLSMTLFFQQHSTSAPQV